MNRNLTKWIAMALSVLTVLTVGVAVTFAEVGSYIYSYDDMFTKRDLKQSADLAGSVTYTVADGEDIHITEAGVYVLTGTASEVTVYVEAAKDDKVQLVLDGVSITNSDAPAIYVKTADKVFVTTSGDSSLSVTGAFSSSDKADGVICSKSDIVFNGDAALTVSSTDNGIVGKDDLKITGGTYHITAAAVAIKANDYWKFVDLGVKGTQKSNRAPNSPFRFKGNPIPIRPLQEWIAFKGIPLQGRDKQAANRSFAINIARKISREGLRATNFMSNAATKEMVDVLTENIAEVLGKSISVATVR